MVPLIAQCITVAEWDVMSETALGLFTGDKIWLAIGLIQDQMLTEENARMEANMLASVHDFLGEIGARHVQGLPRRAARLTTCSSD